MIEHLVIFVRNSLDVQVYTIETLDITNYWPADQLYNELPRDIKETADSKVFKKKLNNLLISKRL